MQALPRDGMSKGKRMGVERGTGDQCLVLSAVKMIPRKRMTDMGKMHP